MQRIDSHQHFWYYHPKKDSWMTREMTAIRRDFMPDDLYAAVHGLGIDGCVTVQVAQTDAETEFLLALAANNGFIKGVVGWVDLKADDINERLEKLSLNGKLKGFRHILQSEPDARYMLQPDFKRGIKALRQHNFTYDVLIYPKHLKYAIEFVNDFPEQPMVVDHLAKPLIKAGKIKEWKKDIRTIAELPNVFCKVSGMVTEADIQNWTPTELIPYLDVVFDAFGPDRLMFGSDWPVCLIAASYRQWVELLTLYTSDILTSDQKINFWGGNAIKFYNL